MDESALRIIRINTYFIYSNNSYKALNTIYKLSKQKNKLRHKCLSR